MISLSRLLLAPCIAGCLLYQQLRFMSSVICVLVNCLIVITCKCRAYSTVRLAGASLKKRYYLLLLYLGFQRRSQKKPIYTSFEIYTCITNISIILSNTDMQTTASYYTYVEHCDRLFYPLASSSLLWGIKFLFFQWKNRNSCLALKKFAKYNRYIDCV